MKKVNDDWYDDLSKDEKRAIQKGLNERNNGNSHLSDDFRKSIRKRIENKS